MRYLVDVKVHHVLTLDIYADNVEDAREMALDCADDADRWTFETHMEHVVPNEIVKVMLSPKKEED